MQSLGSTVPPLHSTAWVVSTPAPSIRTLEEGLSARDPSRPGYDTCAQGCICSMSKQEQIQPIWGEVPFRQLPDVL